jgi:AAA ATPase domain/Origin recognition complex (ORC) subunit 4 C-terminus
MENPTGQQLILKLDGIINGLGDGTRKRVHEEMLDVDDCLYSLLSPCLMEHKSNVSAFIMGPRGSGKSRLVESCLSRMDGSMFYTLRLNGLVIRGNDVGFAVNELLRQLSEIAFNDEDKKSDFNLLRLKRTTFTSNLALLDEIFRLAKIHKRPILIILDEMDAFSGSTAYLDVTTSMIERASDRQLLLYHILDRVSMPGSSLCFIGITSHLGAISLLEKRVRSRAEGNSKIIFVNAFDSYETLVALLMKKLESYEELKSIIQSWLIGELETENSNIKLVRQRFHRSYSIGKDCRWFTRVILLALSLFRHDIKNACDVPSDALNSKIPFDPIYLLDALWTMGAPTTSCDDDNIVTVSRLSVLQDLSELHLSLLFSARRILSRDAKEDIPKPLTLGRMLSEYQSYLKGSVNRFSKKLLTRAFIQMIEMDVFRPSSDHSGGGPLQYEYRIVVSDMNLTSILRLPLHLPFLIDQELAKLMKGNALSCSTTLLDWGKKEN